MATSHIDWSTTLARMQSTSHTVQPEVTDENNCGNWQNDSEAGIDGDLKSPASSQPLFV